MSFNSKQYAWSDVTIALGGRIINGVDSVEYSEKQDKAPLYGRGNTPYRIVRGNKSFEGKIGVWQSELEAMKRDAPQKSLMNLNFDVTVSYIPEDGGQTVIDTLVGCEFTEDKKGMKQGDKNMIVELPFIFTSIKSQQ